MADSPQPSKTPSTISHPSSDAVDAVEESPVFSYISNLSPIQPVKPAPVAQDFPGLHSPPFVFTSPRTNPRNKPSFFKRPPFLQLPSAEICGTHEICRVVANGSRVLDIQTSSGLTPCADKVCDNKSSVHDQAASPSASAEEFLAEIVNMNSTDSVNSASLSSEQADDIPQPVTTKTDEKGSAFIDFIATGAHSAVPEQAQMNNELKLPSDLKHVEAEVKQRSGDLPSDQYPKAELDSSADPALGNQHQEDYSMTDNSSAKHMLIESSTMNAKSLSSEPKNKLHDPKFKAGQDQRGMRRRCLHFEDGQQKTSGKGPDFSNASVDVNYSRSLVESGNFNSSSLDMPATPVNGQVAKSVQPKLFPQTSGTSILKGPKSSGIGLHLNSIVNSIQRGATVSMKSMETGSFSLRGKKSISLLSCPSSEKSKSQSLSSSEAEHVSVSNENDRHERDEPIAENSATALSPYGVKPLNNSMSLESIEQQSTTCEKRKYGNVNNNIVEESSQSSPKKKRKKMPDANDGDGCKRCNCKKTKCLKLYCDCFAAGIYCAEPCACQGCFNRPEYEDTVLETRQQIESRNPLAFAPKVIQNVTEPIANSIGEDGARFTPSSARHKRGCNCKKSMCLKKYCECYQANVGCSDGCRCDGCKNVYGRKEEYGKRKHLVTKLDDGEACGVSFDEKLEMVASRNGLLQTELCNPHNLTPLTPSFEYSDHGKDGSKFLFSSGRFLPSPDSATFMDPYGISPGSSQKCDDRDMIQDSSKEILDLVSFNQELDYGNAVTVNEFSPRYHGPGGIVHPHSLPNSQDWATSSQPRLIYENSHFSPGSSLHWRRSPISPMSYFEGNKFLDTMDYDSGLYKTLGDDTPEILKENITPSNAVKVSSPNKKRVSPPHAHTQGVGSSSSAGLRTSRKFILQAVPSFPPLTPCIESKSDANESTNDSQDATSSK